MPSYTDECARSYDLLNSIFLFEETKELVTVVATNCPDFESEEYCQRSIENFRTEPRSELTPMFRNHEIIFVDNSPLVKIKESYSAEETKFWDSQKIRNENARERRQTSRGILLKHLENCHQNYQLDREEIKQRIADFITKEKELEESREKLRRENKKEIEEKDEDKGVRTGEEKSESEGEGERVNPTRKTREAMEIVNELKKVPFSSLEEVRRLCSELKEAVFITENDGTSELRAKTALLTFSATLAGFRSYILNQSEIGETKLKLAVKFCDELAALYQEFSQKFPTIFTENYGEY
jgi:hypothetical protein